MRTVSAVVVIVVVLLLVGLLALPHLVDMNQYRGRVQDELQQRLGRPVTLGNLHLGLLPPSIRIADVTIGEDPRFGPGPFASAQELRVQARILPLLHKSLEISSLDLRQPHVELVRNAQGVWNFSTIGGGPKANELAQAGNERNFALGNLKITDGQVVLMDDLSQSRAVYDHLDLSLRNFAPDRQFSLSARAHMPGSGTHVIALEGNAGPVNRAAPASTPFDGTLTLDKVAIADLQKFLNSAAPAQINGMLSGHCEIRNDQGKLEAVGSMKLEQARVHEVDLGYPISIDYKILDDLQSGMLQLDQASLKVGNAPLALSGTVNIRATPPELNMHLGADGVSLTEAARLASAFGLAFGADTQVAGRASANLQAQGPVNLPAMNGTLAVNGLEISGNDLSAVVKVPAIELTLSPQEIRSNNFTATADSTALAVQVALRDYTTASPAIDAGLHTAHAEIGQLLGMARAWGMSAARNVSGSGALDLDLHAAGPLKNVSAMNFAGSGLIQNASIRPAMLAEPLRIQNANLQFSNHAASLTGLVAGLGQSNAKGNMTVSNFSAPQVQFALNVDRIDVAALQRLSLTAPAKQGQRPAGPAPQGGLLAATTGQGTVAIGSLVNDQLVLDNIRAKVLLDHGVIRLAPLTSQLYGGSETGAVTINTRPTPATAQMDCKLENVDANQLLSSAAGMKQTLEGTLSSNVQAGFGAGPTQELVRSLNGTIGLNLTNGRILRINMLNQLASIGKFAGLASNAQPFTNVARMSGTFNVRNGVAQTDNLQAQIDGGSAAAAGTVNLVDQSLNLRVTAVLSQNTGQRAGGLANVGGLLSTALANSRGELVIPVIITGTLQQPQFQPDVQKLAEMRLRNLLPTTANPGQSNTGILGALLKGNTAPGGNQQGGVGGILGALGGKQPAQPGPPPGPAAAAGQNQQQANPVNNPLNSIIGGKKKKQ